MKDIINAILGFIELLASMILTLMAPSLMFENEQLGWAALVAVVVLVLCGATRFMDEDASEDDSEDYYE